MALVKTLTLTQSNNDVSVEGTHDFTDAEMAWVLGQMLTEFAHRVGMRIEDAAIQIAERVRHARRVAAERN